MIVAGFILFPPVALLGSLPDSDTASPLREPPAVTFDLQDDEEPDRTWNGAVTAGASATDGNTDITKASATADAVKDLEHERYTLGFSWNFSQDDGDVTQRKTGGRAKYDHFINEKLYWLIQAGAEADDQAGVDLRSTIGAGLGYQFRDDETFKFAGEAGLTWFNEDFDVGEDGDYIAARLSYNWDWKYSDVWEFSQVAGMFPSLEESDDVYTKLDTRVKAAISGSMFAQLQWLWDWDNTPAEGADRSDHLYLLTVGWTF